MAEFKEYPKVIHVSGGTFTVQSAEEEARYRKGNEPDPEPEDLPRRHAPTPEPQVKPTKKVPAPEPAKKKSPKKTFK